jgi:hypothetical protein
MARPERKKKGLVETRKSPSLVRADVFLAEVFLTDKWDHLFPCPLLPNMLCFRPDTIVEGLMEVLEGDTEAILYIEGKTGSMVMIGMYRTPIIDFERWTPNSIKMDVVIHNKKLAKEYGLERLKVEPTKVEEKVK